MKKFLSIIWLIGLCVLASAPLLAASSESTPPGPTPPEPASSESTNKFSNIAIVGIVIGSVTSVAFVLLGSCYLYKYINKKKK